jgi:hypothetical protein
MEVIVDGSVNGEERLNGALPLQPLLLPVESMDRRGQVLERFWRACCRYGAWPMGQARAALPDIELYR